MPARIARRHGSFCAADESVLRSRSEAAQILGVKPRLVGDEWTMARAWLKRELSRGLGT